MNPRQYQKELDRIIKGIDTSAPAPRLLLHSCCGPCSSYVLEYLAPYFEIIVFYDNPNIQPFEEYAHRLDEQRRVIAHISAPHGLSLIEGAYDPTRYAQAVRGLTHLPEGSERCFACYVSAWRQRQYWAKELECDYFTTTLSISPYKNAERINAIGEDIAQRWVSSIYPTISKSVAVTSAPLPFARNGAFIASIIVDAFFLSENGKRMWPNKQKKKAKQTNCLAFCVKYPKYTWCR